MLHTLLDSMTSPTDLCCAVSHQLTPALSVPCRRAVPVASSERRRTERGNAAATLVVAVPGEVFWADARESEAAIRIKRRPDGSGRRSLFPAMGGRSATVDRQSAGAVVTGAVFVVTGDMSSSESFARNSGISTPPMSFITCIIGGRVRAMPCRKFPVDV